MGFCVILFCLFLWTHSSPKGGAPTETDIIALYMRACSMGNPPWGQPRGFPMRKWEGLFGYRGWQRVPLWRTTRWARGSRRVVVGLVRGLVD